MKNEKLIEYLRSSWTQIEASSTYENGDSDGNVRSLDYLYFATQVERMSIHRAERFQHYGFRDQCGLSQMQKNQIDILILKPYFENALVKKGITSIASYRFLKDYDRASESIKEKFVRAIKNTEKSRGILNALLTLRNWAFFPENTAIKKNSRLAASYMKIVLQYLRSYYKNDEEISLFLNWCEKKTRKIFPWGFKKKELRSPPKSALPIHQDEAANYVRHFLGLINNPQSILIQHYAEMVIFLSLCLACGRQHSNYFDPTEILKITKDAIDDAPAMPHVDFPKIVKDIRAKSKSSKGHDAHEVLSLGISPDFLQDSDLWPENPQTPQPESPSRRSCKQIKIKGKTILISHRLTLAIEMLGTFTISLKDVENRLSGAYKAIGLSQSTGGISQRCFLFHPHPWKGIDTRKSWKESRDITLLDEDVK